MNFINQTMLKFKRLYLIMIARKTSAFLILAIIVLILIALLALTERLTKTVKVIAYSYGKINHSDFHVDEFSKGLSVKGLCTAISSDGYTFKTEKHQDSIEWLNDMLKAPDLYMQVLKKKRLPPYERIEKLFERYYATRKIEDLKKLNRSLIETLYPDKTPNRTNDYAIWITYTSKGAFVANQHINAKVSLNNKGNWLNGKTFRVVFNNAYETSVLDHIEERRYSIAEANIVFKGISQQEMSGETDLTYLTPGEHIFSIEIDGENQKKRECDECYFYLDEQRHGAQVNPLNGGEFLITNRDKLHVAPLEARLQVESNDRIFALTLIIIAFMLLQILMSNRKIV